MLLRLLQGPRGVRGMLRELLRMQVLDPSVVVVPDVDERVDHLGEEGGAGRDLLEAERGGEAELRGAGGHLAEQLLDAGAVDPLVALHATADADDAEGEVRARRQQVGDEVHATGGDRALSRQADVESGRGVVPSVGHENEVPLNAVRSHPEEVGAHREGVPDRRASARVEERDEVLDVREVLLVDLSERDRGANRLREGDEAKEPTRTRGILQDAEHGGPGDFDLLPLRLVRAGVRQRSEHALREVQDQDVAFARRCGRQRGVGILHVCWLLQTVGASPGSVRGPRPNGTAAAHIPHLPRVAYLCLPPNPCRITGGSGRFRSAEPRARRRVRREIAPAQPPL